MKRLDVALLVILFVVVSVVLAAQPQVPPVLNTQAISEGRPEESPETHVCYDPSLPS